MQQTCRWISQNQYSICADVNAQSGDQLLEFVSGGYLIIVNSGNRMAVVHGWEFRLFPLSEKESIGKTCFRHHGPHVSLDLSPLILKPSEMMIQEIKYKKGSGNHVTQRYATFEESGNLLVDLKFLTQPAKEFGTCLSVKVTTPDSVTINTYIPYYKFNLDEDEEFSLSTEPLYEKDVPFPLLIRTNDAIGASVASIQRFIWPHSSSASDE